MSSRTRTLILALLIAALHSNKSYGEIRQILPVHSDISPPLAELVTVRNEIGPGREEFEIKALPPLGDFTGVVDHAVQRSASTSLSLVQTDGFEGIGRGLTSGDQRYSVRALPPDIAGAVGPADYVQWVNTEIAIFRKSNGALRLGPFGGNQVWRNFGGPCETTNDSDPVVLYDRLANRWFLSHFAVSNGSPYFQCIAVSRTDDPSGRYARYSYKFDDYPDYGKFGVWPDAYYATFNMFKGGSTFLHSTVCAFDRAKMIAANASPAAQCTDIANGGLLPSDLEGTTTGSGETPNFIASLTKDAVLLWKFRVDWADITHSTLVGPSSIAVSPFVPACARVGCVPQRSTASTLYTLGDRPMFRLSYRALAGVERLMLNHAVEVTQASGGKSYGVRWYEIQDPNGSPSVAQQSTYAPDNTSRWMAAMAMDKKGDILVGFSASSSSIYPAIRFAGHLSTNGPGKLSKETTVRAGLGSQQDHPHWGDYATMTLDPSDDCTFWFSTEYQGAFDSTLEDYNWHTYIVHTKFSSCP